MFQSFVPHPTGLTGCDPGNAAVSPFGGVTALNTDLLIAPYANILRNLLKLALEGSEARPT